MDKNLFAVNPPMGWNSWDCYGASVTEEDLIRNADYMAEHLKPYGWEYVVCDIQWSEPTADSTAYHAFAELCMDEYGRLMPSPNRFPSAADGKGFKPIADYIHSKGLKFGMYSCCRVKTCAGYPGSWGHEFDDAAYFADIGVDFLKYDNCYHPSMQSHLSYNRMALALKSTKRDILYSAYLSEQM